jgi:hypothetical protein
MFIFSWLRAPRRATLLVVVVGVLLLMAPPALQTLAQGNITLDVFRVDVSPQSEFLRLAVNFTVRDSRNRSPRFDRVEYAALERARDSNFAALSVGAYRHQHQHGRRHRRRTAGAGVVFGERE